MKKLSARAAALLLTLMLTPMLTSVAHAEEAASIDAGHTAWMMMATALVLLMTLPGLALFYSGMVRKKNVLATLMHSFGAAALISLVWVTLGYSLAFSPGNGFIGGFDKVLLKGIAFDAVWPGTKIPEMVFMLFQMTFAIITPALIAGAFAERMKFSAFVVFIISWSLIVYAPIAHWVWEGSGWLFTLGALDYAGGTVVHINAGIAGLVAAIVIGRRVGYAKEAMLPHNLVLTLIGTALLWVGWFGFNAGSALNADARAGMAMVVTQVAAAAGAVGWLAIEWLLRRKPSLLGGASGAVAGLVCITPASGFVTADSAILLGVIAGAFCYWAVSVLKHKLNIDDSLDAFGVHGVGGIIGSVLTGVFATNAIAGGAVKPLAEQIWVQLVATGATAAYCLIVTFVLLKLIDLLIGLRVNEAEEREGLDINLHGEQVL